MPKYTFHCQACNARFDRTLKMDLHPTHACPNCKEEAPRVWDGANFGVAFAEGKTPGNSGVHTVDSPSADMAVGRSAEKRWTEVQDRERVKEAARKKGGHHALIRHDGEGFIDYEPMTVAGRQTRKKLYEGAVKATKAAKEATE